MDSSLGCCPHLCRFLLFIINLFFMVLGLAVLILGIVAIVQARSEGMALNTAFAGGAGIFIVTGSVTVVISIIGNFAVLFKLRPLLVIYALVLIVVVILEVVTVVLAFVFRREVQDILLERSLDSIRLYRVSDTASDFSSDINDQVSSIQSTFRCCGFNNANDWFVENPEAVLTLGRAPECEMCSADTVNCTLFSNTTLGVSFNTTGTGCSGPSSRLSTKFAIIIGTLGILFAIFQVFGILIACGLCCCITSARNRQIKGELLM